MTTPALAQSIVPSSIVRLVYMVPSNRSPQPDAEKIIQLYGLTIQRFFRESLARSGHGEVTFEFETEPGTTVPVAHVVRVPQPDVFFHDPDFGTRFSRIVGALSEAGFPPFVSGEGLLVIAEIHTQLPDGSLLPSSVFFGAAAGDDSGVAVVTGETLARMPGSFMLDDRSYAGLVIPTVGPFPLVLGLTFPIFEGTTVSATSSSAQGGAAHELGHVFGLPHEFVNDTNFNGNLMGNGFRGLRGFLHPDRYPLEDVRIAGASAFALETSPFFNSRGNHTDNVAPTIEILSRGVQTPVRGLLEVGFRARDLDSGLAGIVLLRGGNAVGFMALTAQQEETVISTFSYAPGVAESWQILAFDANGNRALSSAVSITPAVGVNRAPEPFVTSDRSRITAGGSVSFDVSLSRDPDGGSQPLQVEWDLDGDGGWDGAPSTATSRSVAFHVPGVYQVAVRLTDAVGDSSVSMPLGIRVDPPVLNHHVTFDAVGPPIFTAATVGCPSGFAGTYSFTAQLRNESQQILSALTLEIQTLTGGNLLLTAERLFDQGELARMKPLEGLSLKPGEAADVPISLCLDQRTPFQFLVNVRGNAQ